MSSKPNPKQPAIKPETQPKGQTKPATAPTGKTAPTQGNTKR